MPAPRAFPLRSLLMVLGEDQKVLSPHALGSQLLPADPVCAHSCHPLPARASQLEFYLLQWVSISFPYWVYPANLNYLYFELFSILVISFSAFSTYSILYNTATNINIYIFTGLGCPG